MRATATAASPTTSAIDGPALGGRPDGGVWPEPYIGSYPGCGPSPPGCGPGWGVYAWVASITLVGSAPMPAAASTGSTADTPASATSSVQLAPSQ